MARIFIIEGREAPDPDSTKTVEEVRQYYATFFPELSNAETKDLGERKQVLTDKKTDDPNCPITSDTIVDHLWEFKKRVGTKGMSRLGPKCAGCKEFTLWVGALIGGTQVYGCPKCGLLYFDPPKKAEGESEQSFLTRLVHGRI